MCVCGASYLHLGSWSINPPQNYVSITRDVSYNVVRVRARNIRIYLYARGRARRVRPAVVSSDEHVRPTPNKTLSRRVINTTTTGSQYRRSRTEARFLSCLPHVYTRHNIVRRQTVRPRDDACAYFESSRPPIGAAYGFRSLWFRFCFHAN